jgi:hypothetical protein
MPAAAPIPIRRVRRDGQVDELGEWRQATKELVLSGAGFPLTPPGTHHVDGDLPWVFDEIAPSGFLATQFTQRHRDLQLPRERRLWTAQQVLDAITVYGSNLSGNLIVGERSFLRWLQVRGTALANDDVQSHRSAYPLLVEQVLTDPLDSSVGGARRKLVVGRADRTSLIVKFTPPLSTATGRRWADLLRMEAHAAGTLRAAGIAAVDSRYFEQDDRGYLEIERFDRLRGGGRVGHVTLFNLGVALYGEASDPEPVIAGLVHDRRLSVEDAASFARQHAFSRAIANTDTHLGNYGLLIDDEGKARLSPAYDVLPMAFAPRHDELPDRLVKHTGERDSVTDELVQRLIAAVEADREISAEFRESWLRVVR